MPAVVVPAPATPLLAVFKFPPEDQAPNGWPAPIHSSDDAVGDLPFPPEIIADVDDPAPPIKFPLSERSVVSVQLVPFHNSVSAEFDPVVPAAAMAAVWVPNPTSAFLAVFKLFTSVQFVPL